MPPAPIRAALAGVVHGITEWLPVSSSGHVALLVHEAGWPEADPAQARQLRTLEVSLHTGSLLPIGLRVLGDLRAAGDTPSRMRLLASGAGATAITSVLGAGAGGVIEERFSGPRAVAAGLAAGSLALVLAERRAGRLVLAAGSGPVPAGCQAPVAGSRDLADIALADIALLGLAQSAALWPGTSRRAATLAVGRARGFDPAAASALSWAAGLPTLVGATAWQGYRDREALRTAVPTVAAGAAASASAGLLTRSLPDRTRRWPVATWAAWRLALAAVTLWRRR